MADIHLLATRQGARALLDLLRRIGEVGNETCSLFDDDGQEVDDLDHRDYPRMVALLAESLQRNVWRGGAAHREGYLRAMADLLCMAADGAIPDDDWDPVRNTQRAFSTNRAEAFRG